MHDGREESVKRYFHISVRGLVEHMLRAGDLSLEFAGPLRAVEGIRAHQKIQRARPENYRSEIPVFHRAETESLVLEIRGRIDGVYVFPDRVVVEEIKSTRRPLPALIRNENPVHWGQLKFYAYLHALAQGLDPVQTHLTYCQVDTGEIRTVTRDFAFDDLETFSTDLIDGFLEWLEMIGGWMRVRDKSIRDLEFPFPEYRQGQRDMAVAVYRSLRDRKQLLVQAPTGIGKTMAALFPALKAMAEGHLSKWFYLTARTTGRMAAETAMDTLRTRGLQFKSLTLTAKDKICPHPDTPCDGQFCPYAKGYYDRINTVLKLLFQEKSRFTREAIEAAAQAHEICPFEFSLDLSLWADGLICDYNYAFDPRVHLRRFFAEAVGDYAFLVDEAHNLVDRAREMFSAELRRKAVLDLRHRVKPDHPAVYRTLGRIDAWLIQAQKRCNTPTKALAETTPPRDLYPLLDRYLHQAREILSRPGSGDLPHRDALMEFYFTARWFRKIADHYLDGYATCYQRNGADLRIKLFCMDPSAGLREALKRAKSAVFFSATLTPAGYFEELFGCNGAAARLRLSSPFPPGHLCLMLDPSISTRYRHREKTRDRVVQAVAAFVSGKPGNYLLFFPSYRYMEMVEEAFGAACPDARTLVQTPGMTESEREAFVSRFAVNAEETLVGFAVMGGVFGEGIDLIGDRLSGAVIVGVGLPGISPERDLIRDHFAGRNGRGYEYAYLFPGINRVFQAVGRVIRSETDRGGVLLIDDRFEGVRYRTLFPPEWLPIPVRNADRVKSVLENFWGNRPVG